MYFSRTSIFKHTAISLLLCIALPAIGEQKKQRLSVKDLAYGTSLYYLYQDQKLNAITAIDVAKQQQTLKNQPDDAELLLGGLYFEYGLVDDSEQILTRMLDEETADETKNRVWFNLARVQYEKNNFRQAEELLSRITQKLPSQRDAQKYYYLTNLFINNNQLEKANEFASLINPQSRWSDFALYNLGVSGLSFEADTQNQQAQQWLSKLISKQTLDEELLSLQDSARLVLGLNALSQNQPEESIKYLGNIHTNSPLTNKALLATGWAWSQLSNPQKALTYWFTVIDKQQQDGATLEAYLAIAKAYEQLDNKALAIQHYEQALQQFEKSLHNMDKAIESINQMDLINTLYLERIIQPSLQNTLENRLPEHFSTPYLHQMFASKRFQQTLMNYQELLEIHNSLIRWKTTFPALELMLVERINSFESKRDLVESTTNFTQLDTMQQQRDALAPEVQRIENEQDYYALADEDEIDYLEQLNDLHGLLTRLQNHKDVSDEIEKYRVMSGLLEWDISTDYPRRYWRLSHQLQLLDRALEQARLSANSLQQASGLNELKLTDFKQRISGQNGEIERMEINASQLIEQQEQLINMLAIEVLENRQQHLTQLRLSARYSLTRLYDEFSKSGRAQ